ncbi:MAG: class II aldolase/adducin family protein [Rhodospirillales bacterium]|nr:class II aldolase/adducin family protein [Alphaproteobacteria bacterium]MBL6947064.1 class II aldolase/adducin family protein [Rhodospirillales bacterium]
MTDHDLRAEILETARAMNAHGINQGTSGNISARIGDDFLITPSGIDYDACTPDDVVRMSMDGVPEGPQKLPRKPSSEWRMHRDLLTIRPNAGAVLHAHPPFATALACLRRPIPAFHSMVAIAGGKDIRCSGYANFGTEDLSRTAIEAMDGRTACLLANHGLLCVAGSLSGVLKRAIEVETLARQYCIALQVGEPVLLGDAEMDDVLDKFSTYLKGLDDGADDTADEGG